jgi:hypothetical protein
MRPPRLATWLLLTFGSGPDVEVIAGDLSEQYAERSRSWYWRQVAYAIVIGGVQHLRQHWVLALRAILIGSAVMAIASVVMANLAYWILPPVLPAPISPSSFPVLLLLIGVPAVAAGAAIARLHRPHAAPFAMAFAMVAVQFELLPRLVFLIRNSIEHERFLPYLRGYVAGMPPVIAIVVTGVLLGTLCGRATYARVR